MSDCHDTDSDEHVSEFHEMLRNIMFQHNASSRKHNAVLREKQRCVLTSYYLNKNTHLALCLTHTSTGFLTIEPSEVLRVLGEFGADLDAPLLDSGCTPAFIASQNGHAAVHLHSQLNTQLHSQLHTQLPSQPAAAPAARSAAQPAGLIKMRK